ncbi:helix-turn-helix domain-containing protein [Micromonospora sp. PLK6-60]|uniref:helix-turn-helix domain-containing protein n=1 Tax=Micromonospora sp. PLK6-60 TaxID=2873383 RepID=UPI001CA7047F|nr:helix-turn-helix domain-containing protein [Micromonospora sp. PLK6-60]MBY8872449.1 helix-turn-helix domain-containing protein [Micromonospora sp. PLK6-60]
MSIHSPMPVPGGLRRWVDDVTVLTADGSGARRPLVHVPDAATSLVLRTVSSRHANLLVVGPRTRASYLVGKEFPLCLRLRLRPGVARLLLGVPASDLVDQVIPVSEVWAGANGLNNRLSELGPDPARLLAHLEPVLLARIATAAGTELARSELVRTATKALTGRPERMPVLARRLAVSERHLRDLFADCVGLSPKRFARITRVRGVLARAGRPAPRWAQLAITAGYYDQSHMSADFSIMMGVPPAAYFAGRRPPAQRC